MLVLLSMARTKFFSVKTGVFCLILLFGSFFLGSCSTNKTSNVLLVGTYNGKKGQFSSIQAAVNAAKPGDTILIAPGIYYEHGSKQAGVFITKPDLTLLGLNRNTVVIDGSKPNNNYLRICPFGKSCPVSIIQKYACPSSVNFVNFSGLNGIEVYKASGVTIENLTVCNYLPNATGGGNEVWINGGDGSGKIGISTYNVSYVTATSTWADPLHPTDTENPAQYGIYVSNSSGKGLLTHDFASNMADSAFYVGACPNCNAYLNYDVGTHSVLGFSGSNAGGNLIISHSLFYDNESGIAPNSLNNDDAPPPQDGHCPGNTVNFLGTKDCTILEYNKVFDNNDVNVPGGENPSGYALPGTGIIISGGQYDLVYKNEVYDNNAWGIILLDYPDTEKPPPLSHCQGGQEYAGVLCLFPAIGNEVFSNTLYSNGGFNNPSNGDLAVATLNRTPGNCFKDNIDQNNLTVYPSGIQSSVCQESSNGDLLGVLGLELACDSGAFGQCNSIQNIDKVVNTIMLLAQVVHLQSTLTSSNLPRVSYPTITQATAQMPPSQPQVPDLCANVQTNSWC